MIDRLEAASQFSSPFYRAISTLFYGRHSSRLAYLAGERIEHEAVNMQIQTALWGPAEFSATGELAAWNRLPDLHRLTLPALGPGGRLRLYDAAAAPSCSRLRFPMGG